ncbi:MAG: ornithine cyclodeaminase [Alphaproteobacteria bacterium]
MATGMQPEPPCIIDGAAVDALLDWPSVTEALAAGHRLPPGPVKSSHNEYGVNSIMNLSAWIDGLGAAVKSCSLFPENTPPVETVQGVVILYDADDGHPKAIIDGASLTRWKTVGDSLLGATYLAPENPKTLLIVGAGVIGITAAQAYPALFPTIDTVLVWNRDQGRLRDSVDRLRAMLDGVSVEAAADLEAATGRADIVSCATRAVEPVILGDWLRPGQHLDLIGAYLPDMREADDAAMQRASLYIDNHANTVASTGDFLIPLANGSIADSDVRADLYALSTAGRPPRDASEITLFKNGGGAHMDLMVADLVHRRFREENPQHVD